MNNESSEQLQYLNRSASNGDMTLFFLSLGRILYHLGSTSSIRIAIHQIENCLPLVGHLGIDLSRVQQVLDAVNASAPRYLVTSSFTIPESIRGHPSAQVSQFAIACDYLMKACSTDIEAWRIHSANRAIRYCLFARFAEFLGAHDVSDEQYADQPDYVQFRANLFQQVFGQIEKHFQHRDDRQE